MSLFLHARLHCTVMHVPFQNCGGEKITCDFYFKKARQSQQGMRQSEAAYFPWATRLLMVRRACRRSVRFLGEGDYLGGIG